MPAQSVDQYETVLAYLRRKYWLPASQSWNVIALKQLADDAFAAGTKTITIIGTASEAGGSASGEMSFDQLTLCQALETLLAEADPNTPPPVRGSGFKGDFSWRCSST